VVSDYPWWRACTLPVPVFATSMSATGRGFARRDLLAGRVAWFRVRAGMVRARRVCRFACRARLQLKPIFRRSAVHVLVSEPSDSGGWSVR
jgi:hypothetical protein